MNTGKAQGRNSGVHDIVKMAIKDWENATFAGKFRGLTLHEVHEIRFILIDIQRMGTSKTIDKKISEWFSKRKFQVEEDGIGWVIRK